MESNVLEKIILQQGQNMIHNALPRTLEPGYFSARTAMKMWNFA